MAYITPKTNWNEDYIPTPQDMNRIEGNVEDNRAEILLEESARIAADSVLDDAITSSIAVETAARIAADNLLQSLPTTSSSSFLTDFPIGTTIVVDSAGPVAVNTSLVVRNNSGTLTIGGVGSVLSGVWRTRGYASPALLLQRVS